MAGRDKLSSQLARRRTSEEQSDLPLSDAEIAKRYEEYCDQQLSGNPLPGIIFALIFFACLMSLPWIVSYLQDEEIIKPQIHMGFRLPGGKSIENRPRPGYVTQPTNAGPAYSPFGKPRQD